MSRIKNAFQNGKAFITFITGGDPDLETTAQCIREMEKAGADMIEIGIPFSDPIAEGPVIQAASARAFKAGTTVDALFAMVAKCRETVQIPLLFMTYANPIFAYGTEKFMRKCREVGIDGIIVPDVPFEEKEEFSGFCEHFGIDLISMVSPTSEKRAAAIAREAQGFLYCVSSLGVTGMREAVGGEIEKVLESAKPVLTVPCAIGFGISTPEQASEMAKRADGVITGSAIVHIIAEHGRESAPYVYEYVYKMKEAINP